MIPAFPHEAAARTSTSGEDPGRLADAGAWAAQAGLTLAPVAERVAEADDVDVVALDATGAVILVVGVEELTAEGLVLALARAATVRDVAPAELATSHPGGADAVRDAWWQVRAGQASALVPAPGLLVLATSVAPAVTAALPLLAGRVQVHVVEPVSESASKTADAEAVAKAADAADATQREQLLAVVALVGEAALVLAGEEGVAGRLTRDGTIVVDGDTYRDPGAAAEAALGAPVADGWAAWRFGADGPFLGEALQEALAQPKAPKERPKRPHRRRAVRG